MATEVNETELKSILVGIYKKYIANPKDKDFHEEAMQIHRKYMHLVGHGFVSNEVETSISNLTEIVQYGKGTINDKEMMEYAKEILPLLESK